MRHRHLTARAAALCALLSLARISRCTAEETPTADPAAIGTGPTVALRLVADGLSQPLAFVPLPDGGALVIEQTGHILALDAAGKRLDGEVLDLRPRLSPLNQGAFDERGLLSLVLHPDFARNRRLFVTYSAPLRPGAPEGFNSTLRLSEFRLPKGTPPKIDPASEIVRLEIDKPYGNHNGARLAFGPDRMLYMAVGDGGNANDEGKRPEGGNAQRLDTLMGKILRLDVSPAAGYRVPADNPFVKTEGARPEIWALGLRNAWGISFDRGGHHDLFAADVGQNLYEEVNLIRKGGNYGWVLREGFHPFDPKSPNTVPAGEGRKTGLRGEPLLDPILEYRHPGAKSRPDAVGVSIVGGYVYRGRALPALRGGYVFADWTKNWGLPQGTLLLGKPGATKDSRWKVSRLTISDPAARAIYICALSEDRDGELYVLTSGANGLTPGKGRLWKLEPAPKP
jgi:glucose/arabinose dehydrogenase